MQFDSEYERAGASYGSAVDAKAAKALSLKHPQIQIHNIPKLHTYTGTLLHGYLFRHYSLQNPAACCIAAEYLLGG